jgi:hypothetical protein
MMKKSIGKNCSSIGSGSTASYAPKMFSLMLLAPPAKMAFSDMMPTVRTQFNRKILTSKKAKNLYPKKL